MVLGLLLVSIVNLQQAAAITCVAPDRGDGTVDGPTTSCNYRHDTDQLFMIIDGLAPGDTIRIDGTIIQFNNIVVTPGPPEKENAEAILNAPMDGTGSLTGFHRDIQIPLSIIEIQTDPRIPGSPVQSFDTDMLRLGGQIPPGDPDFDFLRITAGTNLGLPSPGHTILTNLGGGFYQVDSFFDIEYRIDFVGAPGGTLSGRSGSTTGTLRMTSEAISPDSDGDGIPDNIDRAPNNPCDPIPDSPACHNPAVGGNLVRIDSTSLFLAGIISSAAWMVPTLAVLAGAGVYLVKFRNQKN